MGRTVNYNILFNFPAANGAANGRFQDRGRNAQLTDNSRTWQQMVNGNWVAMPSLVGGREDSTVLLKDDQIALAFGEKRPVGAPRQVQSVQVAAIVTRALDRNPTQVAASPFGVAGNPTALFTGQTTGGASSPTLGFAGPFQITDQDGSVWTVEFYVLNLGTVTEQVVNPRQPSRYSVVVAANVTTAAGTFSFSHDPEVDVGTEQATPAVASGSSY
ncbi:MAG: hypothetical protein JST93_16800 [Acidobacteria bacterium]|nr:hypothetical protein [Acidobacteriota bacterium]